MKKALSIILFTLLAITAGIAQSTKIDATVLLRASSSNSRFLITDGSGNVTWAQGSSLLSAGTGINISGNTITNSAPDQTVSLTGSGITNISGTYPNFTITTNAVGTVQEEGSDLAQQPKINFIGSALTATNNGGSSRTDVTVAANVNGIADLASNGFVVRTGSGAFAARSITASTDASGFSLGLGNADGVSGNPQLAVLTNAFAWKQSARVATTANITLSGNQTLDGVTTNTGDRVLVKNQTTASENGVYITASGAWARAGDLDAAAEFGNGQVIFVEEGTAQGESIWLLTTDGSITVGSTSLAYSRLGRAGQATPGNYGSATQIPVFTLNSDGTISSVTNTSLEESQTLAASDGSGSDRTIVLSANGGGSGGTVTLAQGSGISLTRSGNTITVAASASAPTVTIQRYEEVPVGATSTITVSGFTPLTTDTMVFLDGVHLDWGAGEDITVSGSVITFANQVQANQKVLVKKITVN
ncbi:MAG: hypothetical protein R3D58_07055 [Saprospiraceae bacterium]|nr:hypothetical protein [Lewinellaceae bacterium]